MFSEGLPYRWSARGLFSGQIVYCLLTARWCAWLQSSGGDRASTMLQMQGSLHCVGGVLSKAPLKVSASTPGTQYEAVVIPFWWEDWRKKSIKEKQEDIVGKQALGKIENTCFKMKQNNNKIKSKYLLTFQRSPFHCCYSSTKKRRESFWCFKYREMYPKWYACVYV